jgi:hypothetical protein
LKSVAQLTIPESGILPAGGYRVTLRIAHFDDHPAKRTQTGCRRKLATISARVQVSTLEVGFNEQFTAASGFQETQVKG